MVVASDTFLSKFPTRVLQQYTVITLGQRQVNPQLNVLVTSERYKIPATAFYLEYSSLLLFVTEFGIDPAYDVHFYGLLFWMGPRFGVTSLLVRESIRVPFFLTCRSPRSP